jgi:hypothetical protein
LGCLVYDVAVDKQVRSEIYKQLKGIKDEIADDPATFFPVMGEVLLTVATNNTSDDWKAVWDENADTGKRSHLVTRGTGNAVITAMAGAALIKNLPEIGEKLSENIKKVKKAIVKFKDLPTKGFVDPKAIRFSQGSISSRFRDGGTVEELTKSLKNGVIDPNSIPPIRIVEKDGIIFTLDNRRLKAFQDAGVDIPYEKLNKIPDNEMFKFTEVINNTLQQNQNKEDLPNRDVQL